MPRTSGCWGGLLPTSAPPPPPPPPQQQQAPLETRPSQTPKQAVKEAARAAAPPAKKKQSVHKKLNHHLPGDHTNFFLRVYKRLFYDSRCVHEPGAGGSGAAAGRRRGGADAGAFWRSGGAGASASRCLLAHCEKQRARHCITTTARRPARCTHSHTQNTWRRAPPNNNRPDTAAEKTREKQWVQIYSQWRFVHALFFCE